MRAAALVLSLAATLAGGCGSLDKAAAVMVDGLADYCAAAPDAGRVELRTQIRDEVHAEGLEICLGCPGEPLTYCVGAPRTKVDDL